MAEWQRSSGWLARCVGAGPPGDHYRPGGVGKTSVALAVARELLPDLHHGAWLVDLSTLTTSRAVPQAVARAAGVRESYAATSEQALTAFLRDRELLLVMDNCKHVVDACATLLDELLDQAPGLRVLATSRNRCAFAAK